MKQPQPLKLQKEFTEIINMGQKKDQHGHLLEVTATLKFLHNKICHFPTAMGSYVTLVISMCLLISKVGTAYLPVSRLPGTDPLHKEDVFLTTNHLYQPCLQPQPTHKGQVQIQSAD